MQIERLPTAENEDPILFAWIKHDEDGPNVNWIIDSTDIWGMDFMKDGTEVWQVHREGDAVVVQATQWYAPRGEFKLKVSFLEPDQVVFMAEQCARYVNREDLL